MEQPVIDGFNSHHKVRQDWLPDQRITLGMSQTARFDRCRTCHLGIDRVLTGNVPEFPFAAEAAIDANPANSGSRTPVTRTRLPRTPARMST